MSEAASTSLTQNLADLMARAGWQPEVVPLRGEPDASGQWQLLQLAEVYGRRVDWQTVALSVSEWPDEGTDGSIDLFREAEYAHVDYLVAERGVWSGFPNPPEYSLWRMKKDETDWRFLGHFDKWPAQWTKVNS